MLRPAISLAPLRTGLLQPSLPAPDRSKGRSVMTTGTFVSFLTGLSPAALSALWAAHQTNPSLDAQFKVSGSRFKVLEITKRSHPQSDALFLPPSVFICTSAKVRGRPDVKIA